MSWEVLEGDCRELMKKLGDGSVDAVVTDPPYEYGFMGRAWDKSGIAYQVSLWEEVLRVLKPGGHLVAAGGSRTHHRLACSIEDAGFELRDTICHVFGTGFPKSLDVSKAIDAEAGEDRGSDYQPNYKNTTHGNGWGGGRTTEQDPPVTAAAKRWEGWGTALKPAAEFWTVARKPLEGNVAQNVLKFGTGGVNVDGCRSPIRDEEYDGHFVVARKPSSFDRSQHQRPGVANHNPNGRWPPNFVMSHSPDCGDECAPSCPVAEMDRQSGERPSSAVVGGDIYKLGRFEGQEGAWGIKVRAAWSPSENDHGGASRFFPCFRYEAKAGRSERDAGLGDLPLRSAGEVTNRKDGTAGLESPRAGAGRTSGGRNLHPTVKSIGLMRWLVRLVTPPGGLVLDPFVGSGSTGCAAVAEALRFVGMEFDPESADIARRRIKYWAGMGHQMKLF